MSKFYNNVDLTQCELQNAVIQNLSTAPSNPKKGQHYFDTTQNKEFFYNGSDWISIEAGDITAVNAGNGIEVTNSTGPVPTVTLRSPLDSGSGDNSFGTSLNDSTGHKHIIKLPDASNSAKGVIQIATDAEATTGTDTVKAINAKQLKTAVDGAKVTVNANDGLTGGGTGTTINIALGTPTGITQSTTDSLTADSHTHSITFEAVTDPTASGNAVSFIDTISQSTKGKITATKKTIPDTSTSTKGIIQLATQAEVNAYTDATKAVTPATLLKGQANGVATLDANTKIPVAQLPDFILGQLLFGGSFNSSGVATITTNLQTKLGIADSTIQLINSATDDTTQSPKEYGYATLQGVYFLADAQFTIGGVTFEVGDWLIGLGTKWGKIDNTDAVTGVKGDKESTYRIGNVNLTAANIGALPDDTTFVSNIATGSTNGTIAVTVSGASTTDIAVKGLGSAAYKTVGTAINNVPEIGTALTGTDYPVLLDANGKLKPGTSALGTSAYKAFDTTVTASSSNLITSGAVAEAISGVPQGTVTSVGLTMPTGFSVSGSPVTSSGTLAATFASGYSLLHKYTTTITPSTSPDASTTATYTITHNLASSDITVTVIDTTDKEVVYTDIEVPTDNTIKIIFAVKPTTNSYKIVVMA